MKTYHLRSVDYQGKVYADCSLEIDEAYNQAEVKCHKGLTKKSLVTLTKFSYDVRTDVAVEGAKVRIGGLTVIADGAPAAGEIVQLVRKPTVEAQKQLEAALAEAEDAVRSFLEAREDDLSFSARLRGNPREALMALSTTSAGEGENALDAAYSGYSKGVSEGYEKLTSVMAKVEPILGPKVVERFYALAFAIGSVQDAIFNGESELEAERNFLSELGLKAVAPAELKGQRLASRVVEAAHQGILELAGKSQPG